LIGKLETERRNLRYYLFPAYLVIWLLLFGYVLGLSRKQKSLIKEIEDLKRILAGKGEL